ncbi:hypothetical protein D3C84_1256000 [compost metagenome]
MHPRARAMGQDQARARLGRFKPKAGYMIARAEINSDGLRFAHDATLARRYAGSTTTFVFTGVCS